MPIAEFISLLPIEHQKIVVLDTGLRAHSVAFPGLGVEGSSTFKPTPSRSCVIYVMKGVYAGIQITLYNSRIVIVAPDDDACDRARELILDHYPSDGIDTHRISFELNGDSVATQQ